MVKLDKRHTKKAPWIQMKEQFIASPSWCPSPENCPNAFFTSAANACFNNDCSDINSATQKLLQSSETISLEVGANDDDKTTVTELQRFLFMINQFEKFIPNIAEKSKPLQELLNKKQSRTCGSFQDDVLQN